MKDTNTAENTEQQFLVFWRNSQGSLEKGPMDVLWKMITSYQVDIFNVSLGRITEDFLEFLKHAQKLQLDLAASFTHMAARLIYYKSRALLPTPDFEQEEGTLRLPPELVHQLLEYRKYQMAAEKLRTREEISSGMYTRKAGIVGKEAKNGEELELSLTDLIEVYARLMQRIESERHKKEGLAFELEQYSVEEKSRYLEELLNKVDSFRFEEIFENPQNIKRGELIVTFLALLELVYKNKAVVRQKNNFKDIRIFKHSIFVH